MDARFAPRRCGLLGAIVLWLAVAPPAIAEDEGPKLVGPFTRADYPQALIDRPLTLPAGMVEGELGASFVSQRFQSEGPLLFGVGGADDWNLDLTLRVGITDRVQAEAGTAFSLDHTLRLTTGFEGVRHPLDLRPSLTSWDRVVPFRFSFLALDTRAVDTALTLTLPFVANAERTVALFRFGKLIARNGDGRVLPEVDLGAPTRFRVCDWLWFRAGQDLFAVTTGNGTARFAFDLGVGLQPHPMFAITLDSEIADVTFRGDGQEMSETVADVAPIVLEGTFTPVRWLDFVGTFDLPDVGGGVDNYALRSAVRVRF